MLRIQGWARDGLSGEQISHNMGVANSTFREWVGKFPALAAALKKGRAPVDIEVENKMLESAMGFYVNVREPIKLKRVRQKAGEGRIEEEYIEYAERQVYIPPSQTAQIFWLKNRKPREWRDRRDVVTDIGDNTFRNMTTIAGLINNPEPDIEVEDVTKPGEAQ